MVQEMSGKPSFCGISFIEATVRQDFRHQVPFLRSEEEAGQYRSSYHLLSAVKMQTDANSSSLAHVKLQGCSLSSEGYLIAQISFN